MKFFHALLCDDKNQNSGSKLAHNLPHKIWRQQPALATDPENENRAHEKNNYCWKIKLCTPPVDRQDRLGLADFQDRLLISPRLPLLPVPPQAFRGSLRAGHLYEKIFDMDSNFNMFSWKKMFRKMLIKLINIRVKIDLRQPVPPSPQRFPPNSASFVICCRRFVVNCFKNAISFMVSESWWAVFSIWLFGFCFIKI